MTGKIFHGPNSQLFNDTTQAKRTVEAPKALTVDCRDCHGFGYYGSNRNDHCQNPLCEDGLILLSELRAARRASKRRTRVVL